MQHILKRIAKTALVLPVILFAAAPATSQTVRPGREALAEGQVSLQSSLTLNLPYDPDAAIDPQIEDAQRMVYNLAAKQCAIALSTLASECRITNLSNSVTMQRHQPTNPVITMMVQVTMAVRPK